jgi:hypothetical protein
MQLNSHSRQLIQEPLTLACLQFPLQLRIYQHPHRQLLLSPRLHTHQEADQQQFPCRVSAMVMHPLIMEVVKVKRVRAAFLL